MSYRTESEAKAAGEKLLAKMKAEGWRLDVWENLGWHIRVFNWPVSVSESYDGGYFAAMTGAEEDELATGVPDYFSLPGAGKGDGPNEAVESLIESARDFADEIERAVSTAEKFFEGACPVCSGDKKIMSGTGDDEHPLKAVTCPECKGTGARPSGVCPECKVRVLLVAGGTVSEHPFHDGGVDRVCKGAGKPGGEVK